jgi:hypothetical protein
MRGNANQLSTQGIWVFAPYLPDWHDAHQAALTSDDACPAFEGHTGDLDSQADLHIALPHPLPPAAMLSVPRLSALLVDHQLDSASTMSLSITMAADGRTATGAQ